MTQAAALKIVGVSPSTWKRWRKDRTIPAGVCVKGPKGRWMVSDVEFHRWWGGVMRPRNLSRREELEQQLFPRGLR